MTVLQFENAREKAIWLAALERIKSAYSLDISSLTPERDSLLKFAGSNTGVFAKCKYAPLSVYAIAQSYSECSIDLSSR